MPGGYKEGGLRDKYVVTKVDGSPVDPGAKYFVLRYDVDGDPYARKALREYGGLLFHVNRELATDIFAACHAEDTKRAEKMADAGDFDGLK